MKVGNPVIYVDAHGRAKPALIVGIVDIIGRSTNKTLDLTVDGNPVRFVPHVANYDRAADSSGGGYWVESLEVGVSDVATGSGATLGDERRRQSSRVLDEIIGG